MERASTSAATPSRARVILLLSAWVMAPDIVEIHITVRGPLAAANIQLVGAALALSWGLLL